MKVNTIQKKLRDQAGLLELIDKQVNPEQSHEPIIKVMKQSADYIDLLESEIREITGELS